mgnify:CR=1 FL=1
MVQRQPAETYETDTAPHRSLGERARRSLTPLVAAAFAGALFSLSAPPEDWSLLAWFVPGVLLVAARHSGFAAAYAAGTIYAVVIGSWVTSWAPQAALQYFSYDLLQARLFILAVHIVNPGIMCGLMVAAYARLRASVPPAARAPLAALLWVCCEWMRVWSLGWMLLAHTQYRHLYLIQASELGGAYLVSFVMVTVSVAVAEMLASRDDRRTTARSVLVGPGLALVAMAAFGAIRVSGFEPRRDASTTRTIGVVQASVPNQFRWKRAYFGSTLAKYARLTATIEADPLDLIVWPENAVSFYLNQEGMLRAQMQRTATRAKDGLVVGAPRRGAGRDAFNSIFVLDAQGSIVDAYDKQYLLPFGEYDPIRGRNRAAEPGEIVYRHGSRATPLVAGATTYGACVCYEILFPALVNEMVRGGADVLLNLSNDSWMDDGTGAAPAQHFAMALFRAVETRRYLVRASARGLSGFGDPLGPPYAVLPVNAVETTTAKVVPRQGLTPYVRFGDSWILILVLATAATLAWRSRPGAAASSAGTDSGST